LTLIAGEGVVGMSPQDICHLGVGLMEVTPLKSLSCLVFPETIELYNLLYYLVLFFPILMY